MSAFIPVLALLAFALIWLKISRHQSQSQARTTIRLEVAKRIYELVPFLVLGEAPTGVDVIARRAKCLKAEAGEEDARWIFEQTFEIPDTFKTGKVALLFTSWRDSRFENPAFAFYVYNNRRWLKCWLFKVSNPKTEYWLVRRVE